MCIELYHGSVDKAIIDLKDQQYGAYGRACTVISITLSATFFVTTVLAIQHAWCGCTHTAHGTTHLTWWKVRTLSAAMVVYS